MSFQSQQGEREFVLCEYQAVNQLVAFVVDVFVFTRAGLPRQSSFLKAREFQLLRSLPDFLQDKRR